jgi:putative ABC transport system permease protein
MLELKNLVKKYVVGNFRQTALNGVSVTLRSKEFVSIVGPSGSGKTTLLNMIGGLDRFDSGELLIDHKSTAHFTDQDWDSYRNHRVGFVFQNYNLITHISVLDNVIIGMTLSGLPAHERQERAKELLERVGLLDHINKRPNQLSGGQQQRVAIARALANNPDIILLDEPTGAIDTKTSTQIITLVKEVAEDKLCVMVTHDNKIAETYSDRVITIQDGQIINDSDPYETTAKDEQKMSLKRTYMTYRQALKLSFNNLRTKYFRTLITAFAGSIGIIGIALVISLANGLNVEIDNLEQSTLSEFPIQIDPIPIDIEALRNQEFFADDDRFELFPDIRKVFSYTEEVSTDIKINTLSQEYIDYVNDMDDSLYNEIRVQRRLRPHLLKEFDNDQVIAINTGRINFQPMLNNQNTFLENYDLLDGTVPTTANDLLLVVDEYNRVDAEMLNALGLDGAVESYDFEDFIGMTFEVVLLSNYYSLNTDTGRYETNNLEDLYNDTQSITVTITAIGREKEDAVFTVLNTGIKYHPLLEELYLEDATQAQIGIDQAASNTSVITGLVIDDNSKSELLQRWGYDDTPRQIQIFPKDFETKEQITNYLDEYNVGLSEDDQVKYTDLASVVTELTSDVINGISYVLIAFSAISLVVSSIMIGIITYISVLERTKEIGILRSLGARKRDISRIFNAETVIIGFTSGALGVFLAYLFTFPINRIIESLTEELSNIARLPLYAVFGLIVISVILTLIAGLIPSSIASRKKPVDALRVD